MVLYKGLSDRVRHPKNQKSFRIKSPDSMKCKATPAFLCDAGLHSSNSASHFFLSKDFNSESGPPQPQQNKNIPCNGVASSSWLY
jgi:hypothetical protein